MYKRVLSIIILNSQELLLANIMQAPINTPRVSKGNASATKLLQGRISPALKTADIPIPRPPMAFKVKGKGKGMGKAIANESPVKPISSANGGARMG